MVIRDYSYNNLRFKQALRWLPARLGLVNKGAYKLQINAIKTTDIFLVSYPKSGNTWLRYILATAMKGKNDFSFEELETIIPDVYQSKTKINALTGQRIIKVHEPLFDYFPKVIYIYRDFRDVVVSYYHYSINTKEFKGSLKEFIHSNFYEKYFGTWQNHIAKALEAKRNNKKILILCYEDMLQNPELNISKILHFTELKTELSPKQIADLCEFSNLQRIEKNKGSYFGNNSLFFRQGEATKGHSALDQEDLNYLYAKPKVKELLKELGYLNE